MAAKKIVSISGVNGGEAFDIENFSWALANSTSACGSSAAGGGAGKATFGDFSFVSQPGAQSVPLLTACATGVASQSATLSVYSDPGATTPVLMIKFSDVFISSYKLGLLVYNKYDKFDTGAPPSDLPMESVSFNFASLSIQYQGQPSSTINACTATTVT